MSCFMFLFFFGKRGPSDSEKILTDYSLLGMVFLDFREMPENNCSVLIL